MMQKQKTLKREIYIEGSGLYTGKKARLTLKPAADNTGIVFHRVDKGVYIPATYEYVADTVGKVVLRNEGSEVYTVEHLLSALYGVGVDNCIIEINNDEVPILDGSARGFVERILEAGLKAGKKNKRYIDLYYPVWIVDGDKYIIVVPSNRFEINFTIDFDHPYLRWQSNYFVVDEETYIDNISKARTFGFYDEIIKLKKSGMLKGGSLDNAIVFYNDGMLNDFLIYEDECVRHKMLDLIGDFALLGRRIRGYVIAKKSGHTLDVAIVKKISQIIRQENYDKNYLDKINSEFERIKKELVI